MHKCVLKCIFLLCIFLKNHVTDVGTIDYRSMKIKSNQCRMQLVMEIDCRIRGGALCPVLMQQFTTLNNSARTRSQQVPDPVIDF